LRKLVEKGTSEWRALARHRAQQQVSLLNLLALLVQKYKYRRSCGKKRSSSDAAQLCASRFTGFTGTKVQTLTQKARQYALDALERRRSTALLALLVQKYKY
jgi:hypothetical protein